MRRRQFIAGLGSAATWPIVARAQQPTRMRRVGALLNLSSDDPEALSRVTAFAQGLQQLGWSDGRNVRIDFRWSAGDVERARRYATELLELAPDVIMASGDGAAIPAHQVIRTVPIVFVNVGDPITLGLVESVARPGGNATGFRRGPPSGWSDRQERRVPSQGSRPRRLGPCRQSSLPDDEVGPG
jgi:putative ABC transport system substrate-binding protein